MLHDIPSSVDNLSRISIGYFQPVNIVKFYSGVAIMKMM